MDVTDGISSAAQAGKKNRNFLGAVVIGRNEGDGLLRCLASLRPDCEKIVYVDSGSNDGSAAAAAALGADVVDLDLSSPFTAARARNAGFRRLNEISPNLAYVQFVDGDCEVIEGWIKAAEEFLGSRADVVAVCGRRMERSPNASIYNAMCHREWNTPVGSADSFGGDFLIRSDAFAQVGGFSDEQVAHEEPELCGRLRAAGFRIWRIEAAMTLHDAKIFRLKQFYTRNRRAGFGIAQALVRSGLTIDPGGKAILRRALTWTFAPLLASFTGFITLGAPGFFALAVYPVQVLRHAIVDKQEAGGSLGNRLMVAALGMIGKFGEAHGAIEFLIKNAKGSQLTPIFYK
ncbi:glycosyltransferase family 2 protein [Erythrobacter sp. QSSC1-22B]|uniref:glycosyltransferase family 2 protein n=1 Tax=Erythrobacter sp. QSSC1-22B TaxID=1860125 RepID=UPI0009F33A0B|nr:glycosyltransferase [Erythrobacter sp. QSSC1-22B]